MQYPSEIQKLSTIYFHTWGYLRIGNIEIKKYIAYVPNGKAARGENQAAIHFECVSIV
jgi:hypothetical protein